MKFDEEMRARCDAAYREFATAAAGEKFVDGVSHMFAAGYRLALERAAKVAQEYVPGRHFAEECAAAIRALGSEHE